MTPSQQFRVLIEELAECHEQWAADRYKWRKVIRKLEDQRVADKATIAELTKRYVDLGEYCQGQEHLVREKDDQIRNIVTRTLTQMIRPADAEQTCPPANPPK